MATLVGNTTALKTLNVRDYFDAKLKRTIQDLAQHVRSEFNSYFYHDANSTYEYGYFFCFLPSKNVLLALVTNPKM
jgi:hypothetical protein